MYFPVVPREQARASAMQHLVKTFFGGSSSRAILAFLDNSAERRSGGAAERRSEDEIAEISRRIEQQATKD